MAKDELFELLTSIRDASPGKRSELEDRVLRDLWPRLKSYLKTHFNELQDGDADDLVVVTIRTVFCKFDSYEHRSNLINWCIRICHNLAIDHFRTSAIRRTVLVSHEELQELVEEDTNLGSDFETDWLVGLANKVLELLDKDGHDIIERRVLWGWTVEEIANDLGCSIGTVRSRYEKALLRARKIFAKLTNE